MFKSNQIISNCCITL